MDEQASKQSEESQKRKASKIKKKKGVTKFMISSHKRANYDLKQLKE